MADINERRLPGIGTCHDFATDAGRRIGVVTRHSGLRELVVYDTRDPDAVGASIELTVDESRTLAELLGGTRLSEQLRQTEQEVPGLSIDWLPLSPAFRARTIGATNLRESTGVSIIAIVRDQVAMPAPGPDDDLQPGDVIVVTGTSTGIRAAIELLRS